MEKNKYKKDLIKNIKNVPSHNQLLFFGDEYLLGAMILIESFICETSNITSNASLELFEKDTKDILQKLPLPLFQLIINGLELYLKSLIFKKNNQEYHSIKKQHNLSALIRRVPNNWKSKISKTSQFVRKYEEYLNWQNIKYPKDIELKKNNKLISSGKSNIIFTKTEYESIKESLKNIRKELSY